MTIISKPYLDVREVTYVLGVSRGKAYKIIQQLNEDLNAQEYITIAGKCSRKYFNKKYYGYEQQTQFCEGETV